VAAIGGSAASGIGRTPDDFVTDVGSDSFCSLTGGWLAWSPPGTLTDIGASSESPATAV